MGGDVQGWGRFLVIHIPVLFLVLCSNAWGENTFWQSLPATQEILRPSRLGNTHSPSAIAIQIDPNKQYQSMVGYGASLTEASVVNLNKLSWTRRHDALVALFDSRRGAGLSFLRVPMGATDLIDGSKGDYTYDDTPDASPDPKMSRFTMARDFKTLRLLGEIQRINPHLKIMVNPWTAPPWMKDNRAYQEGSFESQNMEAFALYFIRTIEEYHRWGLEVDYVGIQNEPGISIEYPSMLMDDDQQAAFIRLLAKRLADHGFHQKILANDDNYIAIDRVLGFLNDPATAAAIGGVAFHCWSNDPEQAEKIPPNVEIFETECGGNIQSHNFDFDFHWWNKLRIIDNAKRNLSVVLGWNLVSDENAGPTSPDERSCNNCRGLMIVSPDATQGFKFSPNPELDAIAHASRFIHQGAVRVASNGGPATLDHVAFRNPNGGYVLLLNNGGQQAIRLSFQIGDKVVGEAEVAADAAATVTISGT